jgi:uncharacterized phage protein (TIGR01671 family)
MKREIKFRAWDKITCELKTINQIDYVSQEIVFPDIKGTDFTDWKMFDDVELMQYTGLKDKNGKEIYEGDIYQVDKNHLVYTVFFHQGSFCAGININNCVPINWEPEEDSEDMQECNFSQTIEVIGNIYENPELL